MSDQQYTIADAKRLAREAGLPESIELHGLQKNLVISRRRYGYRPDWSTYPSWPDDKALFCFNPLQFKLACSEAFLRLARWNVTVPA